MGVLGFTLIKTVPNWEIETCKKVLKLPYVREAHLLFGEYDVIAKIEGKNSMELGEHIKNIRAINGVYDTKTLVSMNLL